MNTKMNTKKNIWGDRSFREWFEEYTGSSKRYFFSHIDPPFGLNVRTSSPEETYNAIINSGLTGEEVIELIDAYNLL
jgi:hypothetical protein